MKYTLLVYPNRFGECSPIEELETVCESMKEVNQTINLISEDHPEYDFYVIEEK